jgi:multiple sugar transport system permease protein
MNLRLDFRRREAWIGRLFALPALALLILFIVVPLVMGLVWSTTDKRLISPLPTEFVGFANYTRLLSLSVIRLEPEIDPTTGEPRTDEAGALVFPRARGVLRSDPALEDFQEFTSLDLFGARYVVIATDPTFIHALLNTFLFVVLIVPGQGGLALVMALLVNQRLRAISFFRTAYFTPIVTSMAVVAVVWTFMYDPDDGLINQFLSALTFGAVDDIPWLISTDTAMLAIVILSAWHSAGLQMVIFLAGLQSIPEALYEAARIDGAGAWQQFRRITLPMLRNTTIFVIISTTILAFRVFTQIDVMTRGGPENSTVSVIHYAVTQGYREQRIGYASAITIVFFLIVLIIAFIQRRVLRSNNEVEPDS